MQLCVVGTGYVGLVSAVCFAEKGHRVTCVDVDPERIAAVKRGEAPFSEPRLEELLQRHIGSKIRVSMDLAAAVAESEISLIAVATPFDGREIDLRYIKEASRGIGEALRECSTYHVVVVKSTVVPGTTENVVLPVLEAASGKKAGPDFGLGMNPEFLREGEAVADCLNPDRIVLGGIDDRTLETLEELYRVFDGVDVIRTTPRTAETIKYASNALFATMISFSNEIGNYCAAIGGVDAIEVMQGVHLDRRLSPILPDQTRVVPGLISYLEAGCGFGGSCFPKDAKALVAHGRAAGASMELLGSVIEVNERQPLELVRLLKKHYPALKGIRISILGLSFKPGTDDMRESPSIPVIRELHAQGAVLKAYDPVVGREAEKLFAGASIEFCENLEESLRDVDALLLMTRWPEFEKVPDLLNALDVQPLVVDGRRMLDRIRVGRYEGIGS